MGYRSTRRLIARAAAGFALVAAVSLAPQAAAQELSVRNAWVRAPVYGQKVAGAYMEITSEVAATLVAVRSPVAVRVELHSTTIDGGVMRMRPVERLELPPGKPVILAPGGLHLMLVDVTRPLKAGEHVPLELTISQRGAGERRITVEAEVRGAAATKTHGGH